MTEENDQDDNGDDGDDDDEEEGEPLPESVVNRLNLLKELEETRRRKFDEYLVERAALEAKYNAMYAKIYDERSQIVQDTQEVPVAVEPKDNDDDDVKGVPQFWVCALGNNEEVAAMFNEKDVDCLSYLQNISCDYDEDGKGFTLQFTFSSENPYFTNEVLTKRYEIPNLLTSGNNDEPILKKIEGTEIRWKQEQDLTQNVVIKKQRGKGKHSGQIRTVKKTESVDSFFNFFVPPKMPSLEDMDEETAANLEVAAVMDYEIATALRTQIVPRAVLWFTGEAAMAGEASDDLEAAVEEVIAAVNE